jgi:lipopolysaccharide/colanic/teichoic acid biosynthesis glycosyltransferase
MYKHFIKRIIDIVLSGLALLCLSPILLVVTIWLGLSQPSTEGKGSQNKVSPFRGRFRGGFRGVLSRAFFTQERPGKGGKIFKIYKYKTMTDERDANGNLLPDADRLTKVGKFVRSTSIDELPQLWNVFIGDMSLIGPRPLLTWFLPLYNDEQKHRHDVRPGITGWAQVNGRNCLKYSEKFKYDIWYVNHVSFATDLMIIFMTLKNVFAAKDIASGIDDAEVDDLGWYLRQKEAELLYNKYFSSLHKA